MLNLLETLDRFSDRLEQIPREQVRPAVADGVREITPGVYIGTWRWLFAVLLAASLTSLIWASSRLPETQPPLAAGARRRTLGEALVLVLSNRVTFGYGIASGFVLGFLVAYIASAQQVFAAGYGLGKLFPFAFGSVGARSRWPRSPTPAWSGVSACGGCRTRRWSRISASLWADHRRHPSRTR